MDSHQQRFITFQDKNSYHGLRYKQIALIGAMAEALWYGRTLVVPKIYVVPHHNYGRGFTISWEKYRDLRKSTLTFSTSSGNIELKVPIISEQELAKLNIPEEETLYIGGSSPVSAEQEKQYRHIIYDNISWKNLRHSPSLPTSSLLSQYQNVEFQFELSNLQFNSTLQNIAQKIDALLPKPYCVVHVRYGDKVCLYGGLQIEDVKTLRFSNCPKNIIDKLCNAGLQNHALYLMTNATDTDSEGLTRSLRKKFKVFTYRDFPSLCALVEGDTPDNYALFTVEIVLEDMASALAAYNKKEYLYSVRQPAGKQIVELRVNSTPSIKTRLKFSAAKLMIRTESRVSRLLSYPLNKNLSLHIR